MAFEVIEKYRIYISKSTDIKKTTDIYEGSLLFETDTSSIFIFDGADWVMQYKDVNSSHRETLNSNNSGLVTVNTTVGGIEIVPANSNRHWINIQNNGIEPVLIKFDGIPTLTDYDIILPSSSGVRLGDGGAFSSQTWKKSIYGLVVSTSSIISVFEEEI